MTLPKSAGEAIDYTSAGVLSRQASESGIQGIFGIFEASDGRIWVGFRNALVVFDGRSFQSYTTTQGLVGAGLFPLAEDPDGDLWIASINGPLRLSTRGLKTYDKADGLNQPDIQSIFEDQNGSLNLVGANGSISRLDGRVFHTVRPRLASSVGFNWSSNVALLDHVGDWWFATNQGLIHFSGARRLEDLARMKPAGVYTEHSGLTTSYLYCVFEDSLGDLWISTRFYNESLDSLTRWQRSSHTFHVFRQSDGLPAMKSASAFVEDKSGNHWFGFYQGGLVRYSQGRFKSFDSEDGMPQEIGRAHV